MEIFFYFLCDFLYFFCWTGPLENLALGAGANRVSSENFWVLSPNKQIVITRAKISERAQYPWTTNRKLFISKINNIMFVTEPVKNAYFMVRLTIRVDPPLHGHPDHKICVFYTKYTNTKFLKDPTCAMYIFEKHGIQGY